MWVTEKGVYLHKKDSIDIALGLPDTLYKFI